MLSSGAATSSIYVLAAVLGQALFSSRVPRTVCECACKCVTNVTETKQQDSGFGLLLQIASAAGSLALLFIACIWRTCCTRPRVARSPIASTAPDWTTGYEKSDAAVAALARAQLEFVKSK